jgi:hypothetical protein
MDFGRVKNLLVWTAPEHEKPIRVNDTLLTIEEANKLIEILQLAVKI